MIPIIEDFQKFQFITENIKYSEDTIIIVKIGEEWCAPCKDMDSTFEKIKQVDSKSIFYNVNHSNDSFSDLLIEKKILKIPYILFYKDNKLVEESSFLTKKELEEIIAKLRK